jgi:hypothetical protein
LKFYWFRLSDVLVPLAAALGLLHWIGNRHDRVAEIAWAVVLLAVSLFFGQSFWRNRLDIRPPADRQGSFDLSGTAEQPPVRYRDWRELCDWVRSTTFPKALFVTPLRSQTFKWYAERGEFGTFKDCPQDAVSILAWNRRLQLIRGLNLYQNGPRPSTDKILRCAREHGWDYLVVLRELEPNLRELPIVFRNRTFEVYRFERRP